MANKRFTEYERALLIRALLEYREKVFGIGAYHVSEEEKDLYRELYKDIKRLIRRIETE